MESGQDCCEGREMPRYQSHKKVWAHKIKEVIVDEENARIIPEEAGYDAIIVGDEYVRKHFPKAGGYYVVYEGGYKSFSPAGSFESGYTKIN